ncbi:MAG TPA: recombinase family protein [Desulfovibrio sp.]|uniref:recombinase family protein n=1 Tax=Desulfovibrio sp. TaxID=885 RepID=UPI002C34C268|nr:recombinase family protein [Desulfovibrio sp.]HMM37907.1 recombinase family protein [Desulfovibrio sp.]
MCKTYAYLRVSTDRQDLDNQRREIERYAQVNSLSVDEWLAVEASSRKTTKERGLDGLLLQLKRGDTLIVSEISRLARSVREIANVFHEFSQRGVSVHAVKEGIRANGAGDLSVKLLTTVFGLAGEIERDLISRRTKAGLARVKAEGKRLGNPRIAEINRPRNERAGEFAESLRGTLQAYQAAGLTQRGMVEAMNGAGIKTARGRGPWTLVQLQRVLSRLGL